MKTEWRKQDKALYLPKTEPVYLEIPKMNYITLQGEGNPNSESFAKRIGALYAVAYGIRMLNKSDAPPKDYFEYTVYPLEGVWSLSKTGINAYKEGENILDLKDELQYTLMIRQPEFVTKELFESIRERVMKKNSNLLIGEIRFESIEEGPSVQMTHIGSYDDELASFEKMEAVAHELGIRRISKEHKEIYVTDPKKVPPDKLKTTLRIWVEKRNAVS